MSENNIKPDMSTFEGSLEQAVANGTMVVTVVADYVGDEVNIATMRFMPVLPDDDNLEDLDSEDRWLTLADRNVANQMTNVLTNISVEDKFMMGMIYDALKKHLPDEPVLYYSWEDVTSPELDIFSVQTRENAVVYFKIGNDVFVCGLTDILNLSMVGIDPENRGSAVMDYINAEYLPMIYGHDC